MRLAALLGSAHSRPERLRDPAPALEAMQDDGPSAHAACSACQSRQRRTRLGGRSVRAASGSAPASAATAAAVLLLAAAAVPSVAADFPQIDFGALGQVGIVGAFAGLEVVNSSLPALPGLANQPLNANASTILARAANGTLIELGATNTGGEVRAICQLGGDNAGVFMGGNFSSVANVSATNVASYNPATRTWDGIAGGINGTVDAVFCDTDQQTVVFGGQFSAPALASNASAYLGNVALWDATTGAWSPPNFGGLNGAVRTISQGCNASMVRFGGSFSASVQGGTISGAGVMSPSPVSGTNTSASPMTSGLTPISLAQSELTGGPSSDIEGFSNPAVILCPQGADGPGNSYLFAAPGNGQLTVRTFRSTEARAFRIGNTFYQGRGTKTFQVVSIPDDQVLELIYLDPTTNSNATCSDACPLAHSESIPFQDFIISGASANNAPNGIKTLTGFQFTALDHYGDGAGLHILEVLSTGSWAYAYDGANRGACNSPEPGVNGTYSQATAKGGWYSASYTTQPETTESYLALTDSSANFGSNSDASVAWDVSVPITGNYSIYMRVPGCATTDTCGQRTDVLVTVMNKPSNSGTSTTLSQNVQDTSSVLVWQGEVQAASDSWMPSVVLSIPQAPGSQSSPQTTVVADLLTLQLLNSTFLPASAQNSFGLFEYNVFGAAPAGQGASVTNATLTPLDNFAYVLRSVGVAQNASQYVSSIVSVPVNNRTFVAGAFRTGNSDPSSQTPINSSTVMEFANVASFTAATNGSVVLRLTGGGLLGPVAGMAAVGNVVYLGGEFNSTADGQIAVRNVAGYNATSDTWIRLANGLSGPVSSVSNYGSDGILFTGNFNALATRNSTGGYAIWNATTMQWQPQTPLMLGSVTAGIGAPDASSSSFGYLAASISLLSQNKAPAVASLSQPIGNDIFPMINGLDFSFANVGLPQMNLLRRSIEGLSAFASHLQARQLRAVSSKPAALLPRWLRDATSLIKRQSDPLAPPSLFSDDRNQIMATAFWQRPDGNYSQVVGGNFSTTTGITNLGIYDEETDTLAALPAYPRAGRGQADGVTVVRSLVVVNDTLFVGGDGGVNIFNLTSGSWNSNIAALAASTSVTAATTAEASVSKLVHRPETGTVIASGTFETAGSLPCPSVCEWDMTGQRWSQLGTGFAGTVTDMDFASDSAGTLVVAGSLFVNGVFASLAGWSFTNATWTPYGEIGTGADQIPGPATAMSVDNLQVNSIFVGGRTTDGNKPFLVKWNGTAFQSLGDPQLLDETGISQLTFVPINDPHEDNQILESNRLLVVSGALSMQDYGRVSSAFFDGANWMPFLRTVDLDGQPGIIRGVTRSIELLKFPNLHRLAAGLVILISIAIGLGIVFLLVLLGLIFALTRRRSKEDLVVPISASDDSLNTPETKPGSLLATLNAATENVMGAGYHDGAGYGAGAAAAGAGAVAAGAAAGYATSSSGHHGNADAADGAREPATHNRMDSVAAYGTTDHSDETGRNSTIYLSDGAITGRSGPSAYYTTDSSNERHRNMVSAAAGGFATSSEDHQGQREDLADETQGFIAHARYSFEATHPSELSVRAGQQLAILSDEDESWWLARDAQGQRGVIPATYVL